MRIVKLTEVVSVIAVFTTVAACSDEATQDPPADPSTIQLDRTGYAVSEGDGTLVVTITRTGAATAAISASVTVAGGTATAGTDFMPPAGAAIAWGAGDTSPRQLTFSIVDDADVEDDETFNLSLALASGSAGQLGGVSSATVTIADNDQAPATPGDTFAVTADGRLVSFDRAAPGTLRTDQAIANLPAGESILGGDFRPADGRLYIVTGAGKLYTVDTATAAATPAATLAADPADTTAPFTALDGTSFGLDFNPVPDRLRVVSDTGQNLRINVATGAVTTDGALNGAAASAQGAAYTNSFAAACRTALYVIDAASDTLYLQNPPNDGVLAAVGPLGVDAEAVDGFDIVTDGTGANVAVAALTVGGARNLYLIDLAGGGATAVSAIGTPAALVALSTWLPGNPPTQAPGELVASTAGNRLVTFNRGAPAKLCTSVAITGLASGEDVIGIDFRPPTGALHALGRTGRLYVVDRVTGVATSNVTLSVALAGTEFGMDFNPTGPVALRIVSNTGQNLRVTDPTTGATTADTPLNPGTPSVTAAAYTNSLPLAGTTTLYVIDPQTDRLKIQNPPNGGTLVDVGALGTDLAVDAFDIDGRNGVGLIAAAGGTTSTLHTIDLATGAASASLGTIGGGERIRGLAIPTPQAMVFAATADNQLVTLTVTASAVTSTAVGPISGLQPGEAVLGIDFRPSTGRLHAMTATRVYSVDPATGNATPTSTLAADPADATSPFAGLAGTAFGMDFNPTGPVALRIVSDAEQNLRVPNVANGATITDATLSRGAFPIAVTAAGYSNSFPGATATTLYVIDTLGDRLLAQNPPNSGALRVIGPLGIDADGVNGFEIISADTAVAILGRTLFSVNLATGAATPIGDVPLDDLRGLTTPPSVAAPAPDSVLYAVAGTTLVSFPRNAPQSLAVIGGIVGLQPGETVLGIDFRPVGGALYLLGDTGRVYTVDPTTAAASLVAQLNDGAGGAVALAGTAFGVDFNPVADRLRVVSDTGQNLRIVPDGAVTTVDGVLGLPAPDVVAAAYTRSFAGSTATSLYVIDAATGSLLRQDPPNDGVLTPVGALSASLNFGKVAGFDIAGGHDGVALAALQVTGSTQSVLYRINLATGAATALGAIGAAAGPAIAGLAIRIR